MYILVWVLLIPDSGARSIRTGKGHPEAAENEVGRQQRVHTPLRLADPLGNQCDRSLLLEGHPS